MGWLSSLVSLASAAPGAPGQAASGRPAAIAWNAPGGCPDERAVRASIESMLGGSAAARDGAEVVARGAVERTGSGYSLRMQVDSRGDSEQKSIDGPRCAVLADAFAVIVAFAIDPTVQVSPPRSLEVEPAAREQPNADRRPQVDDASRISLHAGPTGAIGAGLLPFPAFGIGGRLALDTGLRWELAGTFWPDRRTSVTVDPSVSVGARLSLVTVGPSVCVPFAQRTFFACLGGQVGAMQAEGEGVPSPGRGTSSWLAAAAAVAARWGPAASVDVWVRLDLGIPFFRPNFELQNVEGRFSVQAFEPSAVYAVLSVEPEVRFFSTDPGSRRHVQ